MTKIVGIQGGKGSYHEAAARKLCPGRSLRYFDTFKDLFRALTEGSITSAITAIANTRVQFIVEPYDHLTGSEHDLIIVAETYLPIKHCLLGVKGATKQQIKEVHSQAPALGQCLYYLENELPDAQPVEEHDTAGSARLIAKLNDPSKAAIASEQAAALYGLDILDRGIQDDESNITRFIELIRQDPAAEIPDGDKTSMLLRTPQVPGALLGALKPFSDKDINLSCLQSRLIPNTAFDMMFFIEFEAGLDEERTQEVLKQLDTKGYGVTLLGSYRRAPIPVTAKE